MTENGTRKIRAKVWLSGVLKSDKTLEFADDKIDEALEQLAEEHRPLLETQELHLVEIEFLDEPNPLERFFRIGTDPDGMVWPARFEAVAQADPIDLAWYDGGRDLERRFKPRPAPKVDPATAPPVAMLFPRSMNETAIDAVARSLQAELPDLTDGAAEERAEALIAIATHYSIPIEPVLMEWIRFRSPGKLWSGAEWKRWCEKYTALERDLAARGALEARPPVPCSLCGELEATPEAQRAHVCRLICPHCATNQLLRVNSFWQCAGCGEVVP